MDLTNTLANENYSNQQFLDVFLSMFGNSEAFSYEVNINGDMNFKCCPHFCKIFGYKMEPDSVNLLNLVHPDDKGLLHDELDFYRRNIIEKSSNMFRIRHESGKWILVFTHSCVREDHCSSIHIKGVGIKCRFCTANIKNIEKVNGGNNVVIETRINDLSCREKEIFRLISKCNTDRNIAEMLNISVHTAKTHRKNIIHKMGLSNSKFLIRYAFVNKIL